VTISTKPRKVPVRSPRCQGNKKYGENPVSPGYRAGDSQCDVPQHRGEWMCAKCPHDKCLWDAEVPVIRDVVDDYIRGKLNVWL
jgi:hypothetical protein